MFCLPALKGKACIASPIWVFAAAVVAMAPMCQQRPRAAEDLPFVPGDQRKPMVMEHCITWYRQSLLQQSSIQDDCAAGDRVVLSKLNQPW